MPRLFVFGLGFSARALVDRLRAAGGWTIAGTARRPDALAALAAAGIQAFAFDRARPLAAAAALAGTTHLLLSVPPDDDGDPVLARHGADIGALLPGLAWAGYLSTTGVYGDSGGAEVDEATPRLPTQERARRRVAAEDGWLDLHRSAGVPVHLFRLAGIYGPGRSAIDQVRAGTARRMAGPPGHAFSRIHVADIAGVLLASMARPNPGAAYNLADDLPAPSADVTQEACRLLGVAPPALEPFRPDTLSPMARSFYADNRRVANRRIKVELGYRLACPTYREGLLACL